MLIIEDDEPFIELMRATLGLHDVRIARTMQEALAIIDQAAPDVIVLDLSLPDSPMAKTIDSIHDLKARSKNATVIVITGHPHISEIKAAVIQAGAKTVLSKDKGFFNSLPAALASAGWIRPPCASQAVVEKIEATVQKIIAPT